MKNKIIDCYTIFGFYPKRKVDISIEKLIEIMEKNNIEKALSISARAIFGGYKNGNDETLKICKKYKQLIPVGTLDPQADTDFEEEIKKMVDQGVKVFRFFPDYQGWPLKYLPFAKCLEQLSKYRVTIILPYMDTPGMCTDIHEATKGTNLPVIISSASYERLSEVVVAMNLNKNLYIDSYLFSSPDSFDVLKNGVGCDRILFGSGAPLKYINSAIQIVEKSNLNEEDKNKIFYSNLKKLLGEI